MAVAGPPAAIARVSPLLTGVLARRVLDVGATASQAILLKTTSNFITAGLMTLLSEAHVLAEKTGLPSPIVESLIEENLGAYALGVSRRLTSGKYLPAEGESPASGLELGIKDVGHGVGLARDMGMDLRIGEMYLEAAGEAKKYAESRGRKGDSSAVYGVVRQRAGLEFENETVRRRDGIGEGDKEDKEKDAAD
jgi:3-hydroxyisobutyrate dehydrogenase-like beta-hydroxyacid dehydrogenase